VVYEMDKTRNKAVIHILGWKLYGCIVSINQCVTIKINRPSLQSYFNFKCLGF